MQRFLKITMFELIIPNGAPTNFPALANQQVALAEFKLLTVCFCEIHRVQGAQIKAKPLHIVIRQIWESTFPSLVLLIKHLPKT